jgi:UDP-N-acetyl-D-galactosamine dehydrogenase
LAGRKLNDSMGEYVATQFVKLMVKKGIAINGSKVLMLGITFKENCPDVRNTKIIDVVKALEEYGINLTIFDPWASPEEVMNKYQLKATQTQPIDVYDGIILGVSHNEFLKLNLKELQKKRSVIYDVKGVLKGPVDGKL